MAHNLWGNLGISRTHGLTALLPIEIDEENIKIKKVNIPGRLQSF